VEFHTYVEQEGHFVDVDYEVDQLGIVACQVGREKLQRDCGNCFLLVLASLDRVLD
jgi:hypothetical protein